MKAFNVIWICMPFFKTGVHGVAGRLDPCVFLQMVNYHSLAFIREECAVSNVKTLEQSYSSSL